jgi:alpha-tubulin suppressor-like RCC1 family protein
MKTLLRLLVGPVLLATALSCASENRPLGPDDASSLTFRSTPSHAAPLDTLPPVEVAIVDRAGAVVSASSDSVTIAIAGSSGAILAGTTTVAAHAGIARFTDLSIDRAGAYTLKASTRTIGAVTSAPVAVEQPVAAAGGAPIAISGSTTCAVAADRTAWCWGRDADGELGDGQVLRSDTLVAVGGGLRFTDLASGGAFTCGLSGGDAWCWGNNANGSLGDGSASARNCDMDCPRSATPLRVAGGHHYTAIQAQGDQACGLGDDHALWCWGLQHSGEYDEPWLGARAPVADGSRAYVGMATGYYHRCGLTSAGTAYCTGEMLGNGDTTAADRAAVSGGHTFVMLAAGMMHNCGLTASGEAWCWGPSSPLGNGSGAASIPSLESGALHLTSLVGGMAHTCGLDAAGAAWCWGRNAAGELGDGTTSLRETPAAVVGGHAFVRLFAGGARTCGLTAAGEAWCWGANLEYRLDDGPESRTTVPAAMFGGRRVTALSLGGSVMCALAPDGAAWCRGDNHLGQLGTETAFASAVPRPVAGSHTFVQIASANQPVAGDDRTCGLTGAGETWCWGPRSAKRSSTPVPEATALSFRAITVGRYATCGVTGAGQAWCWGRNDAGQLGDGSTTTSAEPVQVQGALAFATVSAGESSACGLTRAGAAWCWGDGYHAASGQPVTAPVAAAPGLSFSMIAVGQQACGLTPQGNVWCWTSNPAPGAGSTNVVEVGAGHTFTSISVVIDGGTCGLDASGQAWCWGNWSGTYVVPDERNTVPVQVAPGVTFTSLTAGSGHACGIATDRTMRCWGNNALGQLGDGTTTSARTPVLVHSDRRFVTAPLRP